jgi:hypothetical protein
MLARNRAAGRLPPLADDELEVTVVIDGPRQFLSCIRRVLRKYRGHPPAAKRVQNDLGQDPRVVGQKRQLLVMFGVYLFVLGSFNQVQMSSGVQVQGHPGEQLPIGFWVVTFAHSS